MKRAILMAVVLVAAGCGGAPESECPAVAPGCDFSVRGACVQLGELREIPDGEWNAWPTERWSLIPQQVEAEIVEGAAFWGANPDEIVRGWTLRFYRDVVPRPDDTRALGQCWTDCAVIDLMAGVHCAPFALPHEMGHIVIDDPDHLDPRWARVPRPLYCPR